MNPFVTFMCHNKKVNQKVYVIFLKTSGFKNLSFENVYYYAAHKEVISFHYVLLRRVLLSDYK